MVYIRHPDVVTQSASGSVSHDSQSASLLISMLWVNHWGISDLFDQSVSGSVGCSVGMYSAGQSVSQSVSFSVFLIFNTFCFHFICSDISNVTVSEVLFIF